METCASDGWPNCRESNSPGFRVAQRHHCLTRARLNTINSLKGKEHGQYIEIKEEKSVFEITT